MNIVDALIILFLGLGLIIGFKQGLIKSTVRFVGLIVVVILAFYLKNPVSIFLYENLPFFNFVGLFKEIQMLNVLVYEGIAFLIVLAILLVLFRIIVFASGLIEKMLNFTIILGIPSKILGAIVGLMQAYIYIFIGLFILNQPSLNLKIMNQSKFNDQILNSTPILSNIANKSLATFNDIYSIKDKFKSNDNKEALNGEVLDIMLRNKLISIKNAENLIKKGKIDIKDANNILDKYR